MQTLQITQPISSADEILKKIAAVRGQAHESFGKVAIWASVSDEVTAETLQKMGAKMQNAQLQKDKAKEDAVY